MPPVGRGEELDLPMGCWRQVQEGEGRIVLLSGAAGIGKSRLLRALREEIGAGLHALAIYSCAPHLSASPRIPSRITRTDIGVRDRPASTSALSHSRKVG